MSNQFILRDVSKSYGATPVLTGINLSISQGETVAIMGPSGSGKSTLLHCMSGILQPSSGAILFGGRDIAQLDDAHRSKLRLTQFGFVFQDGQLLPELTAVENIALPMILTGSSKSRARRAALELLEKLGLAQLANRRPAKMSGGQAQRVAVARALVANPAVIFADEPTGALDQPTGHEMMQLLTSLVAASGTTLIMVTHDAKVASWLNRRVEIRDGIIHDDRMMGGELR
ncbi:ABC transporter ATP-binding protein [Corynebacterium epidermidicanis]|uniref:ABC-type antimicrobial peptide transport system, ATPase component n=1 Tax=Corynebacterium epidermidicanis TaxID=1050174 RepID=A0A0G3GT10_9CORY|nr:ABC transporter ATP-binding protein [Corynebacterium epidermidicanis]AKK04316.1 ABC-type antimicrobial peptide transport system, ATPase component [Corynebacterium epidermidicanis]